MAAMKFSAVRNPNERWLMDLILLFIPSTAPFETRTLPTIQDRTPEPGERTLFVTLVLVTLCPPIEGAGRTWEASKQPQRACQSLGWCFSEAWLRNVMPRVRWKSKTPAGSNVPTGCNSLFATRTSFYECVLITSECWRVTFVDDRASLGYLIRSVLP